MAERLQPSAPPESGSGRTFRIATSILLAIALCQAIAAIWGLASRSGGGYSDPGSAVGQLDILPPPLPDNYQLRAPLPQVPVTSQQPLRSGARTPAAPAFDPTPVPSGGELLLPESMQIRDPVVLESLADGIRLRAEGDAQGALTRFRAASDVMGDNPVILAEMARTFEVMSLSDKAVECWEKIYQMGDSGAGDYYVIADARLRGLDPRRSTERGASAVLSFGAVSQEKSDKGSMVNGETVLLRVPIQREAEGNIIASEVSIYVYFYDRVNGERIEKSTADPPSSAWRTLPINWGSADPEIFEIVYHHPVLSPKEVRELGRRRYFGYVLKLYYQDRLQDIIAKPRMLFDYAPATTLPQIDDILFR